MRQLTLDAEVNVDDKFSKLPVRQLTAFLWNAKFCLFSKLPVRQLTELCARPTCNNVSKLPVRQLTVVIHFLSFY